MKDYFDVNAFVESALHAELLREFDKPARPEAFTCRGACQRTLPWSHPDVNGRRYCRGFQGSLCRPCQRAYQRSRAADEFAKLHQARAARFTAGTCRCGAARAPGKKACAGCIERNRAAVDRYRAKAQRKST